MTRWMAAVALTALVSGGCKDAPRQEAEAPTKPVAAQSCADDGERLPLTGLCAGRAVNYLNMDASASPQAPDGCEWKVMETPIVDDVLLYRGLKCDAGETKLEYAGGAHRAELKLVNSAFLGKIDEPPVYVYVYTIEGDAKQGVTSRAREAMENAAEAAGCTARNAGQQGWPTDALVVDVSPQEAAKAPANEPRAACGPLGINEDEASYWRVAQGYGWFFQLGQDAIEIDAGSFTLMTRQPDGSWGAI
ncbi:hypothetical protein [Blastomonas sp. SL216]|uniref:hypothetical protein n=1 Tax=Blastomonas sp. SL216 TaxID=2995169 RepID=UPI002377BDD9|nr:hypothetical protein OU999_17395 [Blastomonas sp. SL216]